MGCPCQDRRVPPQPQSAPVPMNKRQFMQQYVLSRAACTPLGLDGRAAANAALDAWLQIERSCAQ